MKCRRRILVGILNLLLIRIERIYSNPRGNNTFRILVDRLWPRGLKKDKVKIDLWQKDVAPSNSLRKWFSHDKTKWDEFKDLYFRELDNNPKSVSVILEKAKLEPLTLLFGSKEERFNNARALKEYIEKKMK